MTKGQGWAIVILLLVLVGLWMAHNSNEKEAIVNRGAACISSCDDTLNASAYGETEKNQWRTCVNKCYSDNGLKPLY